MVRHSPLGRKLGVLRVTVLEARGDCLKMFKYCGLVAVVGLLGNVGGQRGRTGAVRLFLSLSLSFSLYVYLSFPL